MHLILKIHLLFLTKIYSMHFTIEPARQQRHLFANPNYKQNVYEVDENSSENLYHHIEKIPKKFKIQLLYDKDKDQYIYQYGPYVYIFDIEEKGDINQNMLDIVMKDFVKFAKHKKDLNWALDAKRMLNRNTILDGIIMRRNGHSYLWKYGEAKEICVSRRFAFQRWYDLIDLDTTVLLKDKKSDEYKQKRYRIISTHF